MATTLGTLGCGDSQPSDPPPGDVGTPPERTVPPTATATSTPTPRPTATPPAMTPVPGADDRLREAARAGDLPGLLAALAEGGDPNAPDARGVTALIAAAYGNHLEVAEALIAAGGDVNQKDDTRQSAYLIATSEIGDSERALAFLRLTLRSGADVSSLDSYNGTGLIRAAERGYVEIVRELLTTPIAIDHVNRLRWTALLEAIILGGGDAKHTEVVRLLVAAGASVNLADGEGVTPLQHARRRGFMAMVHVLEAAGGR